MTNSGDETLPDIVDVAPRVDAVDSPHWANSVMWELVEEVVRLRSEVAYLRSVADDLSCNMPSPRAEVPRW